MDVAVVTGAGRGLGAAIAERLAARGLAVLCTDIDGEAAAATAARLGAPAWSVPQDVRDPEGHRTVAREASERGRLAVWVNNAGVARSGTVWDHSDEDAALMVQVNVLGVVHGSRAAIEAMRGGAGGRILNIASLSAFGPTPGLAVYGATKHAVLALSLSLDAELRDAGVPVAVRALCPDVIDTDMVREVEDQDEAAILFTGTRLLEVGEVADAAMELLDGRRLKRVLPAYRGVLLRGTMFAPRAAARLLPLLKRIGRYNRRRWRDAG